MSYEHDGVVYGDFLSQGGLFANSIVQHASDVVGNYLYVCDFLKWTDWNSILTDETVGDWTQTDVGTQTVNPNVFIDHDNAGGILRLDSDATDGDGVHLQYTAGASTDARPGGGAFLAPAANITHSWLFRCRWEGAGATDHHWFLGFGETSATFMDADGDIADVEFFGFHHNADDDGDGIPRLIYSGGDTVETAQTANDRSISAVAADTWVDLGCRLVGTDRIEWYVNGALRGHAQISSAFTANMCISIGAVMQGVVADTQALDIDLIVAAGQRATT